MISEKNATDDDDELDTVPVVPPIQQALSSARSLPSLPGYRGRSVVHRSKSNADRDASRSSSKMPRVLDRSTVHQPVTYTRAHFLVRAPQTTPSECTVARAASRAKLPIAITHVFSRIADADGADRAFHASVAGPRRHRYAGRGRPCKMIDANCSRLLRRCSRTGQPLVTSRPWRDTRTYYGSCETHSCPRRPCPGVPHNVQGVCRPGRSGAGIGLAESAVSSIRGRAELSFQHGFTARWT